MNRGIKTDLLSVAAGWVMIILIAGFCVRLADMIISGRTAYFFTASAESYMFWLEIIIGTILPVIILSRNRNKNLNLYISSILVISGFIMNRFNVSITGLARSSGADYFPSLDEITITLMLIVIAMFVFKKAAEFLPVFETDKPIPQKIIKDRKLKENKIILSE